MDRALKRRTITLGKKILACGLLLLLVITLARGIVWSLRFMNTTGLTPATLFRFAFDGGSPLVSSDGRINILLLGIGGGNHDGADLTDTMMVLSFDNTKKSLAIISVPRDIWTDSLSDKVNSAYHYGELKRKGSGLLYAKVTVEDVIGLPVQYAMVIDFSGFQKVIDEVGGIDVDVPTAFTDNQYPIPGMEHATCPGDSTNACAYETVHFNAGLQHMDGARALIYARSRHAEGTEGSDFARSKRQQLIMVALKNTLVRPTKWFSFSRMVDLPKVTDAATSTDMNIAQILTIGRWFIGVKESDIERISFEDYLDNPPASLYNNLYVLTPKTSWNDIHAYIQQQLH